MVITEEQRKRAESNRLAALAKRKALSESSAPNQDVWKLFKCRKVSSPENTTFPESKHYLLSTDPIPKPPIPTTPQPEKFRARLEICSPDSFAVTPEAVQGLPYPGEAVCLEKLRCCLSNVEPSHFTQNHGGGKACVYKLRDYDAVLRCLKNFKGIECEEIPWGTLNVVERLSHSFTAERWIPCRPEHLSDETVDDLIGNLPRTLLNALLPFQLEGIKFGLRRGGRCLIADEMGLGKTLQAIAIAGCFINEGPVLVVCPAILRYSWAEELERWLSVCLPTDIHLVFGHQNNPARLRRFPRVVVISYTMLHRLRTSILQQEWALLIVDESHHLRCTKRTSEPREIKAVLDVAMEVKRIVLLSGTPSLSRPYDIFHQIDMLWPGLLGKSKYEFAKTYCSVKSILGCQGKVFQDFSKGIRLEELNVLLKQTVMIRRLKQHVLVQLPPKRRQIIYLLLKRSDIVSAIASAGLVNAGASGDNDAKVEQLNSDERDDTDGSFRSSRKLSVQEVGIAKLSGFQEWLSMHPIIAESGAEGNMDLSLSSHKMIIFAHHHKVLNGVQEFICDKGIGFVRIDGTTLARDRQIAVQSFQSSAEVKIAIIGITAGGVGLDFSSAQNVVFLELPQSPSLMLQAEDRAHRRGQTKAVNIYIFCAKDTLDESHWQNLNKSLRRVSSTTNGKYDAVQEIEVESVSCLETTETKDRSFEKPIMEREQGGELSEIESMKVPNSVSNQFLEPVEAVDEAAGKVNKGYEELNETGCVSSQTDHLHAEVANDSSKTAEAIDGQSVELLAADSDRSIQAESLRFEVSQYTGRIHLYSCISGVDSRPTPLFENFRPEELQSQNPPADNDEKTAYKLVKDNPAYMHTLLAFVNEWNKLRPIERKKLLAKPLQLPLSIELCYLSESLNHDSGGLLKAGSKRRTTPLDEISRPLPSNAVWKKISLRRGHGKKEREYTQGWTITDEPLCKLCQKPCESNDAKTPEYFEDLFCNLGCYEEYRLRTSNRSLRLELFQIEHGICTNCQLNCHKLVEHLKPLSLPKREEYIKKVAPKLARRKKVLDKLVHDPTEGNAWHADHIVAVYRGGGDCRLENMRTLCVACHVDVTSAQCAERRTARMEARKQLKALMSDLRRCKANQTDSNLTDHLEIQGKNDNIAEDELLIKVPGSAYSSGAKNILVGNEEDEKSSNSQESGHPNSNETS